MRKAPDGMSKLSNDIKAIKAMNTRIRYIANKYGLDSQVYLETIKPFQYAKFDAYRNTSKGVFQLSTKFVSKTMVEADTGKAPKRKKNKVTGKMEPVYEKGKRYKEVGYSGGDVSLIKSYIKDFPTVAKLEAQVREKMNLTEEEWFEGTTEEHEQMVRDVFNIESKIVPLRDAVYNLGGDVKSMGMRGPMKFKDVKDFTEKASKFLDSYEEYNNATKELEHYDNDRVLEAFKGYEGKHLWEPQNQEELDEFLNYYHYVMKEVDLGPRKQTPFD